MATDEQRATRCIRKINDKRSAAPKKRHTPSYAALSPRAYGSNNVLRRKTIDGAGKRRLVSTELR